MRTRERIAAVFSTGIGFLARQPHDWFITATRTSIFRFFYQMVLPYLSVTQSAVVQLAYGFGKPVIATQVGDLPKVIDHGRTGLIVPPRDHAALSAALQRFLCQDLAEQMRDAVDAKQKEFSWARLEEILDQVARDSSVPATRA